MSFYGAVNDFFIRHIAEIGFIIISLVYIFFYRYIFIISERIFRGITFSLFENRPIVLRTIGFVDSFIIFILTLIFIIPLIKKILHDFIKLTIPKKINSLSNAFYKPEGSINKKAQKRLQPLKLNNHYLKLVL